MLKFAAVNQVTLRYPHAHARARATASLLSLSSLSPPLSFLSLLLSPPFSSGSGSSSSFLPSHRSLPLSLSLPVPPAPPEQQKTTNFKNKKQGPIKQKLSSVWTVLSRVVAPVVAAYLVAGRFKLL